MVVWMETARISGTGSERAEFSTTTKRTLAERAAFECSVPDCD